MGGKKQKRGRRRAAEAVGERPVSHRSTTESSGPAGRYSGAPPSVSAGIAAVMRRGPRDPMMLYSYSTAPTSCRGSCALFRTVAT